LGDLLTPSAARVNIASTNEEADDVASVEEFTDEEWATNVKRSIEKERRLRENDDINVDVDVARQKQH
jgi:hypothetical protein